MQNFPVTFRNNEKKPGGWLPWRCFGDRDSFKFLRWQESADKSPKILPTIKDSLFEGGRLVSHFFPATFLAVTAL